MQMSWRSRVFCLLSLMKTRIILRVWGKVQLLWRKILRRWRGKRKKLICHLMMKPLNQVLWIIRLTLIQWVRVSSKIKIKVKSPLPLFKKKTLKNSFKTHLIISQRNLKMIWIKDKENRVEKKVLIEKKVLMTIDIWMHSIPHRQRCKMIGKRVRTMSILCFQCHLRNKMTRLINLGRITKSHLTRRKIHLQRRMIAMNKSQMIIVKKRRNLLISTNLRLGSS